MIGKYVDAIIKYRWFVALSCPFLVIVMVLSCIEDLGLEAGYRIWLGKDSKIIAGYENFKHTFGSDDTIVIAFMDEAGIFSNQALGTIERITERLWQTKHIIRVDSITNYQYIHASPEDPDEILVEYFVEDGETIPEDILKQKEQIAIIDEQTRNRTISTDGKTALIYANLIPVGEGRDKAINREVTQLVRNMLEEERKRTGYAFYLFGGPVLSTSFMEIAKHDLVVFTPLVIIAAILILIAIFRRLSGALIAVSVVVLTFLAVISIQIMLGFKINNFTANLPVFVIAIGIADTMHIYWAWSHGIDTGLGNHGAIHYALQKNFFPVFLTSITTFAGFISLSVSEVIPVKTLGIATASASLIAFLLSVTFLPALLSLSRAGKKDIDHAGPPWLASYVEKYSAFIVDHKRSILILSVVSIPVFFAGVFLVEVDSNTVKYFHEDTPIRNSVRFIQDKMTGPLPFEVVIDTKEQGGIKAPDFLRSVERFYRDLDNRFEKVRNIGSLLEPMKRINQVMHGGREAFYRVPDTKPLSAQYLLLYSLSLPQGLDINNRMDVDERRFRITLSVDLTNTSEEIELIRWIEDWWQKTPYTATVHGRLVIGTFMQTHVTRTLIHSILAALALISLVILVFFWDIKITIISLIPNIFPLLLAVSLMGFLGIHIDLGIAVAVAVVIGVAVDDTIHILAKYLSAKRAGKDFREALEYLITLSGVPILFTTVVLSLGFSIFIFSDFNPNVHFGVVTAATLLFALVVDLFLLPSLLGVLDERRFRTHLNPQITQIPADEKRINP
ncbi:efflux RND transporter permease subunit [Candidatus Thiosymbion oneisti]|uniref:efflux RND transporter permease subunit n=1 Tax=Candidatus Thiosymbion oneisti TaxID=589554 RepID=UPI000B7ECDE2|nr:MMPL family transporter [Candidatus Thiosymbion oneisti]